MSLKRRIFWLLIWFLPINIWSQSEKYSGKIWVDSVMNLIQTDQDMDSQTKSNLADSAFNICASNGDICKQIDIRIIQATHLDNIGMSDSALIQLYWAKQAYLPDCDSMVLMSLYRNFTNIYLSLGELHRVDSISRIALSLWNPSWNPKDIRYAVLNNLAIAQLSDHNTILANKTFHQAYNEAVQENNIKYVQIALNNLGSLKGHTGDLDSAYYFFNLAAIQAKKHKDMDNFMSLLINLANINGEKGQYHRAISLLDSAYVFADTLKNKEKLAQIQNARAELFAGMHNYQKAFIYLKEFVEFREQYLDEERVKAVTEMMEKYESEKKARQIQQLELDKLDATLTNIRITNTRNRFLFGGLVILLLAIGLTSRLRYVHKAKTAIQKEKDISEGLLLNILPASVADELKQKGYAEAMQFDEATILFSDFKEFTSMAENMSAAELVRELNTCFKAFDEIMTGRGIEKIKTIGDAYMAAGGIPEKHEDATRQVILAALDMQQFMLERKKERKEAHLPAFDMRVGVHTGPVVAGIVGVKKFQYDIWGDTVNIANRMETHGEIGRVNISEFTYNLIKSDPTFLFTPRGKFEVKGKGLMAMFFVEAKNSTSSGIT